ncbi:hypothetical protein BSR02_13690, partial [Serratia liquefaciens]|uniref:hypothetical protein n=2 Tax=Serratia liquefaciens TaxID=614 RepID=UPI0010E9710C
GWCGFVKALNCEKSAFAVGMNMLRCFSAFIPPVSTDYHCKTPGVMLHRPLHIYGAKDLAVDLHVANIAEKFFHTIAARAPHRAT